MKKTKIIYWVLTILFALFMLSSAIPDLLSTAQAIEVFNKLSMPASLLPFLGAAKILGVIAILVPGYPRIKEWAYAGLMFDLFGATYLIITSGDKGAGTAMMILVIIFGFLSYAWYRKKLVLSNVP